MSSPHRSGTQLKLARIILPVRDLALMTTFYRDVLDLPESPAADPAAVNLDAGGVTLCLQSGSTFVRDDDAGAPRIVFLVDDVETARNQLLEQGVRLGKLKSFGPLQNCDGHDPEGNPFRISNQ